MCLTMLLNLLPSQLPWLLNILYF
jgi:hypothetical protein